MAPPFFYHLEALRSASVSFVLRGFFEGIEKGNHRCSIIKERKGRHGNGKGSKNTGCFT